MKNPYEIYRVDTNKTHTTVSTEKHAKRLAKAISEETGIPFKVRAVEQLSTIGSVRNDT